MNKEIKNIAASVKVWLKDIVKKENKDFNVLCLQYCMERLLYRLTMKFMRKKRGVRLFTQFLIGEDMMNYGL
jgi:hypothetical protein